MFIVSGKSIRMYPDIVKDIVDRPRPTSEKETQPILGLWNFYRRFISNYALLVPPITDLLNDNRKDFVFGKVQEAAFSKITTVLTSRKTPILSDFDRDRPVMVETDASDIAIVADLSENFEDENFHPCAFLWLGVLP